MYDPKEYGLVNVKKLDSSIITDLKYATNDNFTGKKVYKNPVCLLLYNTAVKLKEANDEFKKNGYIIKVWDAYRPLSVQKIFWSVVPDDRYVANPKWGSIHNRGMAVDITLTDLNGNEIEMPSGFDDFTGKALRDCAMSDEAKKNMDYLTKVMENHGFNLLDTEWWHYDDADLADQPVLDIPFENFI